MRDVTESVLLRCHLSHRFDLGDLDLPRGATLLADDVVVVILIHATMTKEFLSLGGDDGINVTFFDEDLQLAIYGREAQGIATSLELLMDLLRT